MIVGIDFVCCFFTDTIYILFSNTICLNADNDQSNEKGKIPAADPLSAGGSTPSVASKKSQHSLKKRPDNGIDLDKTPRKKPKKKIHRPKVVGEGKPRTTTLAPKTPTKSEKPKTAAKKRVCSKKNMSNMKILENSDTPQEEVFVEKTVSLNVPNHLADENTSTAVTTLQRTKNGCEMPGNSSPLCERSDLFASNQSVPMQEYQNHCFGENGDLSFPKKLQKPRSKRRPRSEWKAIVIGVNKVSKKSMSMVGRRSYGTRLCRRIETALLVELQSVSQPHPRKKRTTRCIARRNLAISDASTFLNQSPIAPIGEALADGTHQIEVSSQVDEVNNEALFAAEKRVTEMQIEEEHKNLQYAEKSRGKFCFGRNIFSFFNFFFFI